MATTEATGVRRIVPALGAAGVRVIFRSVSAAEQAKAVFSQRTVSREDS